MMENAAYGYAYAIMTTLFPDGTAPTVRHGTNIHGDLTCKATITIHWENSSLRPGIYAGGEGEVHVTDFTYRTL